MPAAEHQEGTPRPWAVQHVGLTVSDIERSLSWYADLLGVEAGEITTATGPELARALRFGEGVSLRFAFLEAEGVLLELVEYAAPRGDRIPRRNCDVGAVHVCFRVDDIDAAYGRLSHQGVAFSTPPLRIVDGHLRGARHAYFTDPDGIQLQLVETRPRPKERHE